MNSILKSGGYECVLVKWIYKKVNQHFDQDLVHQLFI